MTTKLHTSHVFLDTQVFIAANFQFSSERLKRLADWSRAGKITLYLTDITIREIEGQIAEKIQVASSATDSSGTKASLMS